MYNSDSAALPLEKNSHEPFGTSRSLTGLTIVIIKVKQTGERLQRPEEDTSGPVGQEEKRVQLLEDGVSKLHAALLSDIQHIPCESINNRPSFLKYSIFFSGSAPSAASSTETRDQKFVFFSAQTHKRNCSKEPLLQWIYCLQRPRRHTAISLTALVSQPRRHWLSELTGQCGTRPDSVCSSSPSAVVLFLVVCCWFPSAAGFISLISPWISFCLEPEVWNKSVTCSRINSITSCGRFRQE